MEVEKYVIGIDFGTDSVRAVLVDSRDGHICADNISQYRRWAKRMFCNDSVNEYRHHPLDYIECLFNVLHGVLDSKPELRHMVKGIAVDATGSTPCLVNHELIPLSLMPEYSDNPDAMFVLWKDHSSQKEAEEITTKAGGYLDCVSGHCGPEFFWPKLLRVLRHSPELKRDAFAFIDLCTWASTFLCGIHDPNRLKVAQSVVGSKYFENPRTREIPPVEWFESIDDCWLDIVRNMDFTGCYGDEAYGCIDKAIAIELGLNDDVVVTVGMLDGFCGAVGAGITPDMPVMNLGTSSGYMTVFPEIIDVHGAFTQGIGQILPGMYSVEMGLSAFGDVYAWLVEMLCYPLELKGVPYSKSEILASLRDEASKITVSDDLPLATDFFNGRRSPDQNSKLKAMITGLRLSTSAVELYWALVEATCFATREIIERLNEYWPVPREVMCIGGVSQKSHFVMQMMADITGIKMKVYDNMQACALGSAMCAAVASGIYSSLSEAQKAMMSGTRNEYVPTVDNREIIERRYSKYKRKADIID